MSFLVKQKKNLIQYDISGHATRNLINIYLVLSKNLSPPSRGIGLPCLAAAVIDCRPLQAGVRWRELLPVLQKDGNGGNVFPANL